MNYLAHYRKLKRLKQYEVAKILGISDVMISKFETDKVIPTNEQIVKLSEIYGVGIKKLFPELFGE
jgi:transcriptional regulator with XRE-family HTH domain